MLFIFDKDGTLIGERGRAPEWGDPGVLRPGVQAALDFYREEGHLFAVASNQGGVAFGYLTLAQAQAQVATAAALIGAAAWVLCPYHPDGKVEPFNKDNLCRKPKPGMLWQLMNQLNFDPDDTVMVGDTKDDEGAALAAGVNFRWAQEFFDEWA